MGKKNVCVAFSTQKGGAGKTTLTVLIASYLYYVKGYSIAVVDCDYPQYSIVRMRERDIRMATDDEHYKALAYGQFTRLDKKMYPVITSVPDKVYEQVIAELGLDVLKTFLPDSKRFRRELSAGHRPLFRSTMFPADRALIKGSNLDALAEEIIGIIK